MDDKKIIELFFKRDETAIRETAGKYGDFIRYIAFNITGLREDAEECENDTYFKLWNSIPPDFPEFFKAYIGKITRNTALSLYRKNKAAKRNCGVYVLLSELEECIPDPVSVEDEVEANFLSRIITDWLYTLNEEHRAVFIKRYWYGEAVKSIAQELKLSPSEISSLLFTLRKKLKRELTEKGVNI